MGAKQPIPGCFFEFIEQRNERLKAEFCETANHYAERDGLPLFRPEDLEIVSHKREGNRTEIRYRRVSRDAWSVAPSANGNLSTTHGSTRSEDL